MKIGIFCGSIGFGGSQNTTISLAVELERRGHQITLYLDRQRFRAHKDVSLFEICDLPVNLIWPQMGFISLGNVIRSINYIHQQQHDVVLSVSCGPLPLLFLYNTFFPPIPVVYYEVGPRMRYITRVFHGTTVANSEETRDLLCNWLGKGLKDIPVVRARVDVREFHHVPSPSETEQSTHVVIFMMSRLELEKTTSVIKVMRALELLVQQRINVRLRICGSGRDENTVISIAKKINDGMGKPVVSLIKATSHVGNIIEKSDIVVGVGRCAWEAMACGRPVVVIGQEGIGGVVCKDTINTLMYYNFTARGSGKGEGPYEIAEVLKPLVESSCYRKQLGEYGLGIVKKYYDAAIGAEQMEAVLAKACQATSKKTLVRRLNEFGIIMTLWLCLYSKGFLIWLIRPRAAAQSLRKAISLAKVDT